MITCDLCGEAKDCLQKEIDGQEYDICSECWNPLAKKLRGKGRAKTRETVFLPPPRVIEEGEEEEPKPLPGEPPITRGAQTEPSIRRECESRPCRRDSSFSPAFNLQLSIEDPDLVGTLNFFPKGLP